MKKKRLWLVDVIFWGVIIYSMFYNMFENTTVGDVNKIITSVLADGFTIKEILIMVFSVIGILIMMLFLSLISNIEITAIYIGIKIATKKFKKDRLEKIDFKNDSYYREKIPQYSPAVLSYIDSFEIKEKDIVATLLSLELKKKIKIADKIAIVDDNCKGLAKNEVYILEQIKSNSLNIVDLEDYKRVVIIDAKEKELVKEKQLEREKAIKLLWLSFVAAVIIPIITFLIGAVTLESITNEILLFITIAAIIILDITAFILPFAVIAYISRYGFLNIQEPYVRSKQGREINDKLEGLKKYLKDYSKIDERTKEDLVLWEEFLIYSAMFGTNEELIKDVYAKIA